MPAAGHSIAIEPALQFESCWSPTVIERYYPVAKTFDELLKEPIVDHEHFVSISRFYLKTLCSVKPNRRTGSPGNREATDFFANTIRPFGYEIDAAPFECIDYACRGSELSHGEKIFDIYGSPYSLGCDVFAELKSISTIKQLENTNCVDKLLLMRGEICSEQLMPKNFVFYNPEHHKKIIDLLEKRKPAGIITATEKKPEQVGALYPFPLIVDGDFDIPNAYCRDTVGDALAARQGDSVRLKIDASRLPASATNIIARLNSSAAEKIVFTAHIDAYEDSPGASDNASGTIVLLILAEMLADYREGRCIEIAAFNGEDHYSAGGQMDYLRRYGDELPGVLLAVNIDDVGFERGRSSFSFYECPLQIKKKAEDVFQSFDGLAQGDQWFNGDHMIFVQKRVPSISFTSECMPELMRTVTHTSSDIPEIIDCGKLVEVAESLNALARSL
ncbi:MAG TPA: M28 family peptidase [Anaerolineales bacterium]|nr:M28 family peptidase [Anaerolineales bacterium]